MRFDCGEVLALFRDALSPRLLSFLRSRYGEASSVVPLSIRAPIPESDRHEDAERGAEEDADHEPRKITDYADHFAPTKNAAN